MLRKRGERADNRRQIARLVAVVERTGESDAQEKDEGEQHREQRRASESPTTVPGPPSLTRVLQDSHGE